MTACYCLSARAQNTPLDTPLARPHPPWRMSGFTWHIFTCPRKEMLSKEIKFSPSLPCQLDLRAPAPLHGGGDTFKNQGPLHHSPRFTSVPDHMLDSFLFSVHVCRTLGTSLLQSPREGAANKGEFISPAPPADCSTAPAPPVNDYMM